MKTRWSILVGTSTLFIVICAIMAPAIDGLLVYSPTPERESVFIRNYSALKVIGSFTSEKYLGQGGAGGGSSEGFRFGIGSALPGYVANERSMEPFLTIRSNDRVPLMIALRADMVSQLIQDGAEILSNSGDPDSGFYLEYRIGKSIGSATIAPLTPKRWRERHYADGRIEYPLLAAGTEDMAADISISEKWFPQESNAIRASLREP
ncbi:MAG: hypothetical protein ABSF70_06880 [Terracidiphilus sp.]|jgi:hypothetical protein